MHDCENVLYFTEKQQSTNSVKDRKKNFIKILLNNVDYQQFMRKVTCVELQRRNERSMYRNNNKKVLMSVVSPIFCLFLQESYECIQMIPANLL